MFTKQCSLIEKSIYGVRGVSIVGPNAIFTNATAFMFYPGYLLTASHFVHVENDPKKPAHDKFEAINAEDIGKKMEKAVLVAEDAVRDVAILQIENSRHKDCAPLEINIIGIGTPCGSLGFPLAQTSVDDETKTLNFSLILRFQGANISAFHTQADKSGRKLSFYETDSLMYRGSSGCPGFVENGKVFGMHVKSIIDTSSTTGQGDQASGISRSRLAISLWVPSPDIIDFAKKNGVQLDVGAGH